MRIPFLNIHMFSGKSLKTFEDKVLFDKLGFKHLNDPYDTSIRNPLPYDEAYSEQGGIKVPVFPIPYFEMYRVAKYSDITVTVHNAIKKEIFRNGMEKFKLFEKKCTGEACQEEFETTPEGESCPTCNSPLRDPSLEQERMLDNLINKHVNLNRQHLQDIFEVIEDDHNIVDIGYIIIPKKNYFRGLDGKIIRDGMFRPQPEEIIRGNPLFMRLIQDKQGRPGRDDDGKKIWTCINHRHLKEVGDISPFCPTCNEVMERSFYVATDAAGYGGSSLSGNYDKIYYIEGEVHRENKFSKGIGYGNPPMISIYPAVQILNAMNKLMYNAYENQRYPRRIPVMATNNQDTMEKAFQALIHRVRSNPEMPPLMFAQTDKKGKFIEMIDMMATLDEMQFIEARNELRKIVGGQYGVMPLFTADLSSGGGLNNEGLQVTVTSRAADMSQAPYNKGYIPFILEQFGITDFGLRIKPSEEKDQMSMEQRNAIKIANAQSLRNMGFPIENLEEDEGEYIIRMGKEPTQEPITQMNPFNMPKIPGASNSPQRFQGEPNTVTRSFQFEKILGKALRKPEESLIPVIKNTEKLNLNSIISETLKAVEEESGQILKRGPLDKELRIAIERNIFSRKFKNLTALQSRRVKISLMKSLGKGVTLGNLIKSLQRAVPKLSDFDAERIIRTEQTAIVNTSREFGFRQIDPQGLKKYRWVSIPDKRRTKICQEITDKTSGGVSIEELKKIISQTSRKFGQEPREWIPHINCRSIVGRNI